MTCTSGEGKDICHVQLSRSMNKLIGGKEERYNMLILLLCNWFIVLSWSIWFAYQDLSSRFVCCLLVLPRAIFCESWYVEYVPIVNENKGPASPILCTHVIYLVPHLHESSVPNSILQRHRGISSVCSTNPSTWESPTCISKEILLWFKKLLVRFR